MPRNEPADALKAALMILVVVGHVFLESVSGNAFKGAIYVFHMPMFLALSGYWFKPPRDIADLLRKAIPRYLSPWVIATALYFSVLWIIRSEVPFTILRALSAPWFHLWFVPALFLFCFITTLLRKLPALAVLSVFFLPHLAIWAGFPVEEITGPIDTRYITYGLYFAVGYCWREHSPRLHWSVPLAMLIIGAALAWSLFPLGGKWPDVLSRSLLSGGAIGLVHAFSSVGLGSLSDNLFARESLAIYLYHYLPILLMKSYANLMSSGTYWVVSLFAGLVVVPMAISAARRLPFSELVLGTLPSLQKILRDSSLSGGGQPVGKTRS